MASQQERCVVRPHRERPNDRVAQFLGAHGVTEDHPHPMLRYAKDPTAYYATLMLAWNPEERTHGGLMLTSGISKVPHLREVVRRVVQSDADKGLLPEVRGMIIGSVTAVIQALRGDITSQHTLSAVILGNAIRLGPIEVHVTTSEGKDAVVTVPIYVVEQADLVKHYNYATIDKDGYVVGENDPKPVTYEPAWEDLRTLISQSPSPNK